MMNRTASAPPPSAPLSSAIRTVALFEAFKGMVVLVAASGLFLLIHEDIHALAAKFIAHMHLNPASEYPHIFLDASAALQNERLSLLAFGASVYAIAHFVEAYGLFRKKAWAEVLAALSGAIYIPFELAELIHEPAWHIALLLVLNVAIVALMVRALVQRRKRG